MEYFKKLEKKMDELEMSDSYRFKEVLDEVKIASVHFIWQRAEVESIGDLFITGYELKQHITGYVLIDDYMIFLKDDEEILISLLGL